MNVSPSSRIPGWPSGCGARCRMTSGSYLRGVNRMPPEVFDAWQRSVWDAWEAAGHYERGCDGWMDDPAGNVACTTCLEAVPMPEGVSVA